MDPLHLFLTLEGSPAATLSFCHFSAGLKASGPVLPRPQSGPSSWRGSRASEPKAPRAGYPPDPAPTGPQPAGASTAGLPMGRRLRQGEGEAVGAKSEGETMDTFFFFIETSLTHSVGFCRAEFHASGM